MSKVIDLTGEKFGEWTVLERSGSDKRGQALWKCKCSCGTIKNIVGSTLRNKTSSSCGCKRTLNSKENNGKFVNEVGNRYGKLIVVEKDIERSGRGHRAYWICKCDCGNYKTVSSKCLRDGKTKSCGCLLSAGEETIAKYLSSHEIKYEPQYKVFINDILYRFDFALLNGELVNCLIEYNGIQHYDEEHLHWGQTIDVTQQRDSVKRKWAEENNIPLYVIPYWEFDNIDFILSSIVQQCKINEGD